MRYVLLSLAFFLSMPTVHSADPQGDISTVDIKGPRIVDIAYGLSEAYQVRVCVEESAYDHRRDDADEVSVGSENGSKGYQLSAENAHLHEALDRLIADYPDYAWSHDETTGIFNIFPRENAPGDWYVRGVDISRQSIRTLMLEHDAFGMNERGIAFNPGRGNWSWLDDDAISIVGDKVMFRTLLNSLCAQLGDGYVWSIERLERPRVLWYTHHRVDYELRFRPAQFAR